MGTKAWFGILRWRLLKAVVDIVANENYRRTAEPQMSGVKKLLAEDYNRYPRTSKEASVRL